MSQSPHILMVDDDGRIRQMYRMYLNVQGFEVAEVSNAVDALQEIYNKKFDAVLLDIGLGDSNGMDLIDPIKAAQPNAPIFVFTGKPVDAELKKEAFARGAFQLFMKSNPLDYVVSELRRGIQMYRIAAARKNSAA